MKRIGLLCPHASPLAALGAGKDGGANTYVWESLRALAAMGIEARAFARGAQTRLVELAPGASVQELADLAEPHDEASAQAFARAVAGNGFASEAWWSHYWTAGRLAAILRTDKVRWAHSGHTWALIKRSTFSGEEVAERETAERAIVRDADLLVAHTTTEAEQLSALYGAQAAKVVVAPPGVSEEWGRHPRLRRADGPARVLFVGRLEPIKGPDLAIRAFAASGLAKSRGRLWLVGAGSPGYEAELGRLAKQLGVEKQVEFKGALGTRLEMLAVYAQADCLLVPSRSESFGLAALEAQAAGLPVVAAEVGGLPNAVAKDKSGLLAPAGDAGALGKALASLWEEPGLLEKLSAGAPKQAELFSWQATVEAVVKGLEGSGAKRKRPSVRGKAAKRA